jgi:hypothetical protein
MMRRNFSVERLGPYLAEAVDEFSTAVLLYQWDTHCSSAFWEVLSHLEVALRNALDQRMTRRQHDMGLPRHWLFDDAHQLGRNVRGTDHHAHPYQDIAAAMRRVRENGKLVDPSQVISELPFGFWHQLVSRRQMFLWPDLAAAFSHAPSRSPVPVRNRLARLRSLRNRIGHHHRLSSLDLAARWDDLLTLANWIDPALGIWIESKARVPAVLATRPTPSRQ